MPRKSTVDPEDETPGPDTVGADDRRRVEHNIDRIEDRLRDAPDGLHAFNPPADPELLARCPLPAAARLFWAQWDGLELASGELRLWPLPELIAAQPEADEHLGGESRLRPGDLPIGERGGDLLVLCADPHAEGADVVLVEEDGERLPHSSTVDLLVLAMLGEVSALYDEEGEFQEQLFGPDGKLTRAAERRLLRRHLDLDPDAPLARFRLAQSLRRAGELRAAAGELRQLLRRAPEFAWAHLESGRVHLGLGAPGEAARAFTRGAELASDPDLQAYFLAWACLAASEPAGPTRSSRTEGHAPKDSRKAHDGKPPERAALAAQVLARGPEFARSQEAALRAALEAGDATLADESLRLGLAVVPGHVGLLSLRPQVDELRARPQAAAEEDELADETDREIAAANARAEADAEPADEERPRKPNALAKAAGKAAQKKSGGKSSGQAARKGGRKPPTKRR